MMIIPASPPNIAEIKAAFDISSTKGIMFAWGDKIYVPDGGTVSPSLLRHEGVHGQRQGADVAGWWRRYIDDPKFRLAEEIPAHRAEYGWFCENVKDRNKRAYHLAHIAARLSGPLYGSLITQGKAVSLIR